MKSEIDSYLGDVGVDAREASFSISTATLEQKSKCLRSIAEDLHKNRSSIKKANIEDINEAEKSEVDSSMLERLRLDDSVIDRMIEGLGQIDLLPDPIGQIRDLSFQSSGIQVGKMRVPLGVVAMIYESRPNVTIDAAGLAIKSGNAIILRGGSESFLSNQELGKSITRGLVAAGLPKKCVQLIKTTDRAAVGALLALDDYVDVIVPRGGKDLIQRVSSETKINVIKHLDGVCHVYVDDPVDMEMAVSVAFNSKSEKYGVCNAMETLLVHQDVAREFLSDIEPLFVEKGVELRCCPQAHSICSSSLLAEDSDWTEEYLGPVLSIRIVEGLDEAIDHINKFGSHHTDVICTSSFENSRKFIRNVDSASVMVNSSSQFADGFEYGLGAEIGISTDKIHARGPVGLEGLTTEKYVVFGNGEIRKR